MEENVISLLFSTKFTIRSSKSFLKRNLLVIILIYLGRHRMTVNENEEKVSLFRIFGQEPALIEVLIEESFTPILSINLPCFITDSSLMWVHKDLEAPLHFHIVHPESLRNVRELRSIRISRIIAQRSRQHLY